jgi:hypothetical protein
MPGMTTHTTITVEFDEELLTQLREGAPGKTDRELLEELAINELGNAALANISEAFADVLDEEIEAEAVKAVHQTRAESAAEQTAA